MMVSLTGCNEYAKQMQLNQQAHERALMRMQHDQQRKLAAMEAQNRLHVAEIEGQTRRQINENNSRALAAVAKKVIPMLALLGAAVACFYFWAQKTTGIRLREIDKEEAVAIGKARYEAITKAIALLPENERTPLLEKWAEKGGGPLALEHRT
jgi:hypothetical protein